MQCCRVKIKINLHLLSLKKTEAQNLQHIYIIVNNIIISCGRARA